MLAWDTAHLSGSREGGCDAPVRLFGSLPGSTLDVPILSEWPRSWTASASWIALAPGLRSGSRRGLPRHRGGAAGPREDQSAARGDAGGAAARLRGRRVAGRNSKAIAVWGCAPAPWSRLCAAARPRSARHCSRGGRSRGWCRAGESAGEPSQWTRPRERCTAYIGYVPTWRPPSRCCWPSTMRIGPTRRRCGSSACWPAGWTPCRRWSCSPSVRPRPLRG